ncbi:MAG: GGDEF domain-containing protein [Thermodesulfobacteriota bacterium]
MTIFGDRRKEIQSTIAGLQELIDRLRRLEESYLQQEEALTVISEFANDWEYWQDPSGTYKYVSPSCENVTGYKPEHFYADPDLLQKIIVPRDWSKWQKHSHTMAGNGMVEPVEFEIRTRTGETKWIHHICRAVFDSEGENIGIRGSNRDITDLKALQDKLLHVVGHDPLTGLPNRLLMLEHLGQSVKEADRNGLMFVIAFIDLDDFKTINDRYGHEAGDHVLQRVAADLRTAVRDTDIVARIGGDEFVGIFQITSPGDTTALKERILARIKPEIICTRFALTIRLSIGMSIYPLDGRDIDTLLGKADKEMYAMKKKNKATLQAAG